MTEEMSQIKWCGYSVLKLVGIIMIIAGFELATIDSGILPSILSGLGSSIYVISDMQQQKYTGVKTNE